MTKKKTTSTTGSKPKTTSPNTKVTARTKSTPGSSGSNSKPGVRKTAPKKEPTTAPRKKPVSKKSSFSLNLPQKALIAGIVIIFITAVLVLSLLSPSQGQLTSALASLIWQAFGWGGVIVPIITGVVGVYLVLWGMEQPPSVPIYRVVGFSLFFIAFAAFASLAQTLSDNGLHDFWAVAEAETGGGYFGGIVGYGLTEAVGTPGAILILVVIAGIGTILFFGVTRTDLGHFFQAMLTFGTREEAEPDPTAVRDIPINTGSTKGGTLRRSTTNPGATTTARPATSAGSVTGHFGRLRNGRCRQRRQHPNFTRTSSETHRSTQTRAWAYKTRRNTTSSTTNHCLPCVCGRHEQSGAQLDDSAAIRNARTRQRPRHQRRHDPRTSRNHRAYARKFWRSGNRRGNQPGADHYPVWRRAKLFGDAQRQTHQSQSWQNCRAGRRHGAGTPGTVDSHSGAGSRQRLCGHRSAKYRQSTRLLA